MVPVSLQPGKLVAWKWTESPNEKTPYIAALWEITKGPYAGQILGWRGFVTEAAIEATMRQLGFAGYDGTAPFSDLRGFGTREVMLDIRHEEVPATSERAAFMMARVAWLKKLPTLDHVPSLSPSIVNALPAARLCKPRKVEEHTNGAPTSSSSSAPTDAPPSESYQDEEIPF